MVPVDEDIETITIRVPSSLKDTVEETAGSRGVTLTTFVRQALQDAIAPRGRIFERPGLTEKFDDFIKETRMEPVVVLVASDSGRDRFFVEGKIDKNFTGEAVVTIAGKGDQRWVLPRADVVAWFKPETAALLNKMAMALTRQGWTARSAAY